MAPAPVNSQAAMDTVHVILTLCLFGINVLLTHIISKKNFWGRLKYIGHEMVFLSLGIAAARLFLMNTMVVLTTILIYLFLWAIALLLTQQVIDAGKVLVPQTFFTMAIGIISVYGAASGYLEHTLSAIL